MMNAGFAVVSVGLMLIVLGVDVGGFEGRAEALDLKFDFKTGSTGVAVFVIGALMISWGGALKNKYEGSTIPKFADTDNQLHWYSLKAFESCRKKKPEAPEKCFYRLYGKINKGVL